MPNVLLSNLNLKECSLDDRDCRFEFKVYFLCFSVVYKQVYLYVPDHHIFMYACLLLMQHEGMLLVIRRELC